MVLRGPLRLAVVQAVPWLVGVLLFAAVDARWSATLAVAVACMIALGGITTVTVAYRLTELALRREVARVFVLQPPSGNGVPGVALRSLGTWVMGTGVPLLGLVISAGTSLIYSKYFTVDRLGLVTLVLALLALAVGFLVTALTSTSLASSVLAVRRALRRVENGDLDVTVEVSDTTELGLLQAGFNTMVAGLRERDRVRELFGQQVGEDVAAAAVAGQVELGGEVATWRCSSSTWSGRPTWRPPARRPRSWATSTGSSPRSSTSSRATAGGSTSSRATPRSPSSARPPTTTTRPVPPSPPPARWPTGSSAASPSTPGSGSRPARPSRGTSGSRSATSTPSSAIR